MKVIKLLLFLSLFSALKGDVSSKVLAHNLLEHADANRAQIAQLCHIINRAGATGNSLTPHAQIAAHAQAIIDRLKQERVAAKTLAAHSQNHF